MLSTDLIMAHALKMAGLDRIPPDCGIYVPGADVRKVLFGVDIGVAELLLARELDCDLALAHHPIAATMDFARVLDTHVRWMEEAGVPSAEAETAIAPLRERVELMYHRGNWAHVVSVARLLGMSFMNIHSPLDLVGRRRMVDALTGLDSESTVGDVVDRLGSLHEYRVAPTEIKVVHGSPGNPAGRVAVVHGAGTNGGARVARAYFEHGVSTVVYIHIDQAEIAQLREYGKGNLVMCGHIAGDLLGLEPFCQWLQEQGLEVVRFSGLDASG